MSPRSPEEFEKIRDESRTKIKDAALRAFSSHGYEGASMARIAKGAGVSKGLIYNYFASKEELLEAVIFETIDEMMAKHMSPILSAPVEKQLKLMIHVSLDFVVEDAEFWSIYSSILMNPAIPVSINKRLQEITAGLTVYIVKMLEVQGFENPEKEARVLAALIDGIQLHALIDPKNYPITEMRDTLIERYCKT